MRTGRQAPNLAELSSRMRSVDGAKSAQRKQHKTTDVATKQAARTLGTSTAHFALGLLQREAPEMPKRSLQ